MCRDNSVFKNLTQQYNLKIMTQNSSFSNDGLDEEDLRELLHLNISDTKSLVHVCLDAEQLATSISLRIVEKVLDYIVDKSVGLVLPSFAIDWFDFQRSLFLLLVYIENDEQTQDQSLIEDLEPPTPNVEHWRRIIAVMDKKNVEECLSPSLPPDIDTRSKQSSSNSKRSRVKIQSQVLIKSKPSAMKQANQLLNINFVNMEPPEVEEEDPKENGMRLAYERELQLRLLQQIAESARSKELKEFQKQLRQVQGNQSKNNITYDFEGRLLAQCLPKYDRLPSTQLKLGYDFELVEKISPQQAIQKNSEIKKKETGKKEQEHFENQVNKLTQYYPPQISEKIVLEKGVTFHEGNSTKQGPSFGFVNYSLLNNQEILANLTNPKLNLSKEEYKTLISKQSYSGRLEKKGKSKTEVAINVISANSNNESFKKQIFNTSNTQIQITNNNNSSILNATLKRDEQSFIRIHSENESILEHFTQSDQILEDDFQRYDSPKQKLPPISATEQFSVNILSQKDWGQNINEKVQNKPKLPLILQATKSLPLLVKNPRNRILNQATEHLHNQIRLPPPNVGKVIGHAYKGFNVRSK